MRLLTTKFGSYDVAQYEKKIGGSVMELLDVGNLELNKIAQIVKLGNHGFDDEQTYNRIDEYLASDPEHSVMSLFFDAIKEMDMDLRILKACGTSIDELKKELESEASKMSASAKEINEDVQDIKEDAIDIKDKVVSIGSIVKEDIETVVDDAKGIINRVEEEFKKDTSDEHVDNVTPIQ